MTVAWAGILADAVLLLHVAVVLFVVAGLVLALAGGPLGWRSARSPALRWAHLAAVAVIALQSWLGQLCPLTVWEQALRERAGQAAYRTSLVEHWLAALLYVEAPWWSFVLGYSLLLALVALAWWRWPPRPWRRR
jgi:hypothetical protein